MYAKTALYPRSRENSKMKRHKDCFYYRLGLTYNILKFAVG